MTSKGFTTQGGIFSFGSNFEDRFIPDYKRLKKISDHCKGLGLKVVLTQGTYDMVHIGHARYFEEAKKHGDILVVGVDSDKKVRDRKGPDRPIVPQNERLEMVTHLRSVDIVTLKEHNMPQWHLIKSVSPDVLIVTRETVDKYGKEKMKAMKKFCGQIKILEPQAVTSTSAKIRLLQIKIAKKFESALAPKLANMMNEVLSQSGPKHKKLK